MKTSHELYSRIFLFDRHQVTSSVAWKAENILCQLPWRSSLSISNFAPASHSCSRYIKIPIPRIVEMGSAGFSHCNAGAFGVVWGSDGVCNIRSCATVNHPEIRRCKKQCGRAVCNLSFFSSCSTLCKLNTNLRVLPHLHERPPPLLYTLWLLWRWIRTTGNTCWVVSQGGCHTR